MNVAHTNFGAAAYSNSIFASPRRFQFTNRQTRRVLRVLRSFACGENFSSLWTDTHHISYITRAFHQNAFWVDLLAYSSLVLREMRGGCFERKSAARIRCGHTRRKLSPLFTPKYFNAHTPQMDECSRIWSTWHEPSNRQFLLGIFLLECACGKHSWAFSETVAFFCALFFTKKSELVKLNAKLSKFIAPTNWFWYQKNVNPTIITYGFKIFLINLSILLDLINFSQ